MALSVRIDGTVQLSQVLKGLSYDLSHMKSAMSDIGNEAKRYFSGQVFASRGGAINQRWAPLNAAYAVWKARHYAGRPPMIRTGALQQSFTSDATNTSVTIGNDSPYFKYHQSTAARKRLPRRAMIGMYSQLQSDALQIINDVLLKGARSRGR